MAVIVCVSAPQRRTKEPRVVNIMNYRGIDGPLQLLVITNSGYKGEDQDHLAARGALIALSRGFKVGDSRRVGWPEGLSRQSSYSAVGMLGPALNMAMMIHEVESGAQKPRGLSELREQGRLGVGVDTTIGARAVYQVERPTDGSMHIHALKYKEWLRTGQVQLLVWLTPSTRARWRDRR